MDQAILQWEDELDSMGPFASKELLLAHYEKVPSVNAPSLSLLKRVLLTMGAIK